MEDNSLRVFLVFLVIFSFFCYWSTWEEYSHLSLTRSVVEENTLYIDSFKNLTGDRLPMGGHWYSTKFPGVGLLGTPIYHSFSLVQNVEPEEIETGENFLIEFKDDHGEKTRYVGRYENPSPFILNSMILLTILVSGLSGALLVTLVYKISDYFLKKEDNRILLTFAGGLGTLIFPYSLALLREVPATFLAFISFFLIFRKRENILSKKYSLISGILLGFSTLVFRLMLVLSPIFLGYFIYTQREKKDRILYFLLGLFLGILPSLVYNYIRYSDPLLFYLPGGDSVYGEALTYDLMINFSPYIALRLLFYPFRGLFFHSPILIPSVLGLFFMWKKMKPEAVLIILIFVTFLLLNSLYFCWFGGLTFGSRYLVPVLPFLILPLSFVLKRVNMKYIVPIMALSIFISFIGLQTIAPGYDNLHIESYREDLKALQSFEIRREPFSEHYIPLFFRNGPRSRLFEGVIDDEEGIDIRHWSPQFGGEDKYMERQEIFSLEFPGVGKISIKNWPFVCLIPLGLLLGTVWFYRRITKKVVEIFTKASKKLRGNG